MKVDPNLDLNYSWAMRESGWNVGMDSNLLKLGTVVHLAVINDTTTEPPESPDEGDRYLIPNGAVGDWLNHEHEIALWIDGDWNFYVPKDGWTCWVKDRKVYCVYDDEDWHDLMGL